MISLAGADRVRPALQPPLKAKVFAHGGHIRDWEFERMDRGRVIDAHVLLGTENHLSLEAEDLLRRMDVHQIEMAIARSVGAELAVDNSSGNNRVLTGGNRIRGMVSANPWFGKRAVDELKRCRDLGAAGLFLHPARQGFFPSERIAAPLLELALEFRWPIMFHTGTFVYSDILAVANVARRYPEANFIAGFGGFTDMWFELPGLFEEVRNLFLDASLIWGGAILDVVSRGCADRVLFGSGEPRNRYGAVLKCFDRLELSEDHSAAIFCGNARRIFSLQ